LLGYGGMNLAPRERDAGLRAAMEAVADGSLRVRIDEILPLEQVNDAFARLRDHRVQGKLLLDLRQSRAPDRVDRLPNAVRSAL
jgi:NADPH:quinone reductase-like Zn-dependent oxidoreductase